MLAKAYARPQRLHPRLLANTQVPPPALPSLFYLPHRFHGACCRPFSLLHVADAGVSLS